MSDLDARRREALAGALSGHREDAAYPGTCLCENAVPDLIAEDRHARHVADALAPLIAGWLAEAEAEALREAAEDFATGAWADAWGSDGVDDDVSAVRSTERWLLARADRVGGAR